RPGVAHVEPLAGGVGELDEAVKLLPGLVPGDGGEGLLLQPPLLPLLLNAGKIVLHVSLLIPVNGFLCGIYFCRGAPGPRTPVTPRHWWGESTAQPSAALPLYGCGVPLAGKGGMSIPSLSRKNAPGHLARGVNYAVPP